MNPFPNQETAENQQDRPPFLQFNSAMHVHDKRPSLADFEQLKINLHYGMDTHHDCFWYTWTFHCRDLYNKDTSLLDTSLSLYISTATIWTTRVKRPLSETSLIWIPLNCPYCTFTILFMYFEVTKTIFRHTCLVPSANKHPG